jgi:glutathione S-transferase
MERTLDAADFLAGASFTLAEIATAVWAHRWFELKLDRDSAPKLAAWYRKLLEREAFVDHVVFAYE